MQLRSADQSYFVLLITSFKLSIYSSLAQETRLSQHWGVGCTPPPLFSSFPSSLFFIFIFLFILLAYMNIGGGAF